MANKFDYNKAKLEMSRNREDRESLIRDNPKTKEELAKAELDRKRSEQQAEVNDVLYADASDRPKLAPKPVEEPKEEEPEVPSVPDEDEPENEPDYEEPKSVKKATSVQSGSLSSNEALVSDFVKNLSENESDEEYADDSAVYNAAPAERPLATPEEVSAPPPMQEPLTRRDVARQQALARASKPQGVSTDDVKVSVIKNFPTELLNTLKLLFPSAKNQTDVVTAFVYLSLGRPADIKIPDSARELLADYRGDDVSNRDVQDSVSQAISQLKISNKQMMQKLSAVELVSSYILFDRLGFRKKNQKSADDIDFLENGMADLMTSLEKQSELKTVRDTQKKGSPIR